MGSVRPSEALKEAMTPLNQQFNDQQFSQPAADPIALYLISWVTLSPVSFCPIYSANSSAAIDAQQRYSASTRTPIFLNGKLTWNRYRWTWREEVWLSTVDVKIILINERQLDCGAACRDKIAINGCFSAKFHMTWAGSSPLVKMMENRQDADTDRRTASRVVDDDGGSL